MHKCSNMALLDCFISWLQYTCKIMLLLGTILLIAVSISSFTSKFFILYYFLFCCLPYNTANGELANLSLLLSMFSKTWFPLQSLKNIFPCQLFSNLRKLATHTCIKHIILDRKHDPEPARVSTVQLLARQHTHTTLQQGHEQGCKCSPMSWQQQKHVNRKNFYFSLIKFFFFFHNKGNSSREW